MGKKKAKVLEGRTREERIHVRKNLGSLKSLTVQPRTKQRYNEALGHFFAYLKEENLTLPKKRDAIDPLVSDYVEHLWSSGASRAEASNFLAGLQDFDPKLKHQLPGSWRLMKTWTVNEAPNRAPPFSERLLHAMVGWSRFHGHHSFGLSLLVGFYGLLRTGELLALRARDVQMSSSVTPAVLSLGMTKGGKRQGAAESVTLGELPVLKALWHWKSTVPSHAFLTSQPHHWRQMFNTCLEGIKAHTFGYRPYSLRRGGATFFFLKHGSLDRILIQGRWTAVRTARIYINSGLAMMSDIQIPPRVLAPFLLVYKNSIDQPTLEPVLKNRSGGRGKEVKSRTKRTKLAGLLLCPSFIFLSNRYCLKLGFHGLAWTCC